MTSPAAPETGTGEDAANQSSVGDHGGTAFSMRAVERLVAAAIKTVPGIATVDSKLGGFSRRAYPRVAVQLDPDAHVAAVDCAIATVWPSPITDVSVAVQDAVAEAIEAYLGFKTTRVNVAIGRTVPGMRVSQQDLAARPVAAARAPQVTPTNVWQPQVKRKVSLKPVVVKHPLGISSSTIAPRAEVRSPSVNDIALVEVRTIGTPNPAPVRSVSAPEPQELVPVNRPKPMQTRPVSVPKASPLKPVTVRPSNPVQVQAPRPQPLRAIEVRPLKLKDIRVEPTRIRTQPGGRHE